MHLCHRFCQSSKLVLQFWFYVIYCSNRLSFHWSLQFWENENVAGSQIWWYISWGMLFLAKISRTHRCYIIHPQKDEPIDMFTSSVTFLIVILWNHFFTVSTFLRSSTIIVISIFSASCKAFLRQNKVAECLSTL